MPILAQTTFQGPDVQWFALSPLLVLVGGGLGLLLLAALVPRGWPRGGYAFLAVTTASASGVLAAAQWNQVDGSGEGDAGAISLVGGALNLDRFTIFLTVLVCSAAGLTSLLLDRYLRRERLDGAEVYGLVLMCTSGAVLMAAANELIVLFLGLEILSMSFYVMAASHARRTRSQESAMKYFILGSLASAFFLYGVAFMYGATGTTSLPGIADYLARTTLLDDSLLLVGLGLMTVGLAFKVAAVPFQWWVPDVYQGAPSPISGFMASVGKAAAFAALVRVLDVALGSQATSWQPVVYALAILTLLVGSTMAIVQTDVKRMLAYSSISHAGFLLIGVQVATTDGVSALLFYLAAYAAMSIGSFGVVTSVAASSDGTRPLESYRGLSRRRPLLAFGFTVLLLSQAGMPLTSGFIAKLGVIRAAVDVESWVLAVVAMLAAVITAFVYLRVIIAMYLESDASGDAAAATEVRRPIGPSAALALVLCVAFTVVVGVLPDWLVELANDAVPQLPLP